jgi:hypothetical protein
MVVRQDLSFTPWLPSNPFTGTRGYHPSTPVLITLPYPPLNIGLSFFKIFFSQQVLAQLLEHWSGEAALAGEVGIDSLASQRLYQRFVRRVLLSALGPSTPAVACLLRTHLSHDPPPAGEASLRVKALLRMGEVAGPTVAAGLRARWREVVTDQVFTLLCEAPCEGWGAHPGEEERPVQMVGRLTRQLQRLEALCPREEGSGRAFFVHETEAAVLDAWRRLSRPVVAVVAEAIALVGNRHLDPFRPDWDARARGRQDAALASLGSLVRALGCNEDVRWFYEELLSRRLLRGRTVGLGAEEAGIRSLGLEGGAAGRMVQDVRASQRDLRVFLAAHPAGEAWAGEEGIDSCDPAVSVVVASPGGWPHGSIDTAPLTLPPPIRDLLGAFQAFYTRPRPPPVVAPMKTSPARAEAPAAVATAEDFEGGDWLDLGYEYPPALRNGRPRLEPPPPMPPLISSNSAKRISKMHPRLEGPPLTPANAPPRPAPSSVRLLLCPRAGSVIMTYKAPRGRPQDLFVSPLQAAALWMFNKRGEWALSELSSSLGLPPAEGERILVEQLQPLLTPPHELLERPHRGVYALSAVFNGRAEMLVVHGRVAAVRQVG